MLSTPNRDEHGSEIGDLFQFSHTYGFIRHNACVSR